MKPIHELAKDYGISEDKLISHGPYIAKVKSSNDDGKTAGESRQGNKGNYIAVSAITPTPFGEGKTTTSIGLTQGLGLLGHKAIVNLRQPSLGPIFGFKGGATGGGKSLVVPTQDINLHLTGDLHAVSAAHNLLSAAVDAEIYHQPEKLNIDPESLYWPRVVDINDRGLRQIVTGLGGKSNGVVRETGFAITAASEIMGLLGLSRDLDDLRQRIGRIVVGFTKDKKPVTAEQLEAAGAMTAILHNAIYPNLLQTLEGQAAFIHGGPFANISHGTSTVIADRIALNHSDYVVTEAGFGSDIGFEKFCNIKTRNSGLKPKAAVLVATVRALKLHGGGPALKNGRDIPSEYVTENLELLQKGMENLRRHIEGMKQFGIPVIVAVNQFPTDSPKELELLKNEAIRLGAYGAAISNHFGEGGQGAVDLAELVVKACEEPGEFKLLYSDDLPLTEKTERIADKIYGAEGVTFSPKAKRKLRNYTEQGYGSLPVCIAKTQYSFSHDPKGGGCPAPFTLKIEDAQLAAGGGYIYLLAGSINTMPGLPKMANYRSIDIDTTSGEITGLV